MSRREFSKMDGEPYAKTQIKFEQLRCFSHLLAVRHFRNIVFALAALLWLPVSAHCQLESVPGFEFLRCNVSASTSHSPAKDCGDCCAVEKSQYKAEQQKLTVPTPDLQPVDFVPVLPSVNSLSVEVSLGILTAAPPELPQRWHFLSRTALPARAPSVAS